MAATLNPNLNPNPNPTLDMAVCISPRISPRISAHISPRQIALKLDEARASRDALAKAIYGKLFGWVVQQVTSRYVSAASEQQEVTHCA